MAVAYNRKAAAVMGINVQRMVVLAFVLSSALAGLGGVLIAPITFAWAYMGTVPGIKAFAAAIIGGLENPIGILIGGLAVGRARTVLRHHQLESEGGHHLPVRPADPRRPSDRADGPQGDREGLMRLPVFAYTGPRDWVRFLVVAAIVSGASARASTIRSSSSCCSRSLTSSSSRSGSTSWSGWTGQISLGHAGLYAVGAYTSALLATRAGWPFWLSAPIGVVLAGVCGRAAGASRRCAPKDRTSPW